MSATLTLSCKLKVTEAQTAKLSATLSAFTQALNWVNAHTDPAQSYRNGKKFKCGHCGWEGDADFNSAKVIALLGAVVNQPRGLGLFCSLVEHNRLRATESTHRTALSAGGVSHAVGVG